jgi:dTDP-4-dehydrorhamnose reductase
MSNLKILKKKVFITGANGLLGQKLVHVFLGDYDVLGAGIEPEAFIHPAGYKYTQLDITKKHDTIASVQRFAPSIIVNAAALTDVDACEDDREDCWKINVGGAENLAYAAKKCDAFFVQVSTDYVFDGVAGVYTEETRPNPLGYYGKSKLAGENAVVGTGAEYVIVRTMVLYGVGASLRPNFATWLVEKLAGGERVNIVDDQYGHPTLVDDLAQAILRIVELRKQGIFHVTGSQYVSRYDFALALAEVFGFDPALINRIKTADLNQRAPRPMHSRFSPQKLENETGVRMHGVAAGLSLLKKQLGY